MSDDALKRHIHETIAAATTKANIDLRNSDDVFSAYMRNNADKLRPLVDALKVVKAEITSEGVEISIEPSGENATVTLKGRTGKWRVLNFHANYPDCGHFRVFEEKFSVGSSEETFHHFDTSDEVLSLVLSCIGDHIAEQNYRSSMSKGG